MPTVLLAEDDPDVVLLLRTILEMEGYGVMCATNGEDALELLELGTPSLVILDVCMPRVGGLEVLAAMRARAQTRNTPVLMMSAVGDDTTIFDSMCAGGDYYLPKPFQARELAAAVKRLLAA